MDDQTKAQFYEMAKKDGRDLFFNDPIGLPDDKDKENIAIIIKNFEAKYPGVIKGYVEHAKQKQEAAFNDFSNVTDKNMQMRHVFTMPVQVIRQIEEAYPLMFTNKKHMAWFRKNFPMFNTSKRY